MGQFTGMFKPSNILIAEDERILLTDFGLVLEVDKGTRGEVFGSLTISHLNRLAALLKQYPSRISMHWGHFIQLLVEASI
jgi:serine/threonine protein kinase